MPVSFLSFTEIKYTRCGGAWGSWLLKEKVWTEKTTCLQDFQLSPVLPSVHLHALTLPSNQKKDQQEGNDAVSCQRELFKESHRFMCKNT